MPFIVHSNIESEFQAFRQIATESQSDRRAMMNQLGFYLLDKEKAHFNQLAKTGSSNGVTWPKHADATAKRRAALARRGRLTVQPDTIGIMTGFMASRFRFRANSNQVRITNTAPYQGAFSVKRPIYPATFPAEWLSGCDSIVQSHSNKVTGGLSK